jgi:hypothetical protein
MRAHGRSTAGAARHRTGTLTRDFPPGVATTKPRIPDTASDTEAGYHALAWPAATVQPPATARPPGPDTHSSHRVPGAIPLTCTCSCRPHGWVRYRTAAAAPVRGSLPRTVADQGRAEAAGCSPGGVTARDTATAPPLAITTTAAAIATRRHLRCLRRAATRSSSDRSATSGGYCPVTLAGAGSSTTSRVISAAGTLPSRPGRAASPASSSRQSTHHARWLSTEARSAGPIAPMTYTPSAVRISPQRPASVTVPAPISAGCPWTTLPPYHPERGDLP